MEYTLKTERLGLRNWKESDIAPFFKMCSDAEVMKYFPSTLSLTETTALVERLQQHFNENGYTYFAVDELATGNFIGFIGIKYQTWKSEHTPCVDIGWRVKKSSWGNGYATEGAKACLEFAFKNLKIKEVYSFAVPGNEASENVMKKIGMEYIGNVIHPGIKDDPRFPHCIVYKIEKKD